MVTREFLCPNCGRFEVRQHITDAPLETCPECGNPIRQVFSPPEILYMPFYDVESDEFVTHRS